MSQNYKKSKNIPSFLQKLYNILENTKNECAIMWSSNGVGFVIINQEVLTKIILPKYFKHSNYSSFIRQLNMYDFHKIGRGNIQNYFHHDKFIQGDLNKISQIKRKPEKKKALKNNNELNLNQIQRFYSENEISQQKVISKKTTNKTQITLNSVHTIKARSQESIILMRENIHSYKRGQKIYYQECESNDNHKFSRIKLNSTDSFQNEEYINDDISKMSINNQIQSKTLIEHQKQILVPSLNNLFTFFTPYQLTNFGFFI